MKVVVIYALLDVDGRRRYVGKSTNPALRFRSHSRRRFSWAVSWNILEECDVAEWPARERLWIAYGREHGWPLENVADGGNGIPEWYRPTATTRAKLAARAFTPEWRAKLAEANRHRITKPETRAKMAARLGPRSPEARARIAIANRSVEAREKNAASQRGRRHTPETRAKIAEAHRGLRHTPETRAKLAHLVPWNKGKQLPPFTPEHRANISTAMRGKTPWNKGRRFINDPPCA